MVECRSVPEHTYIENTTVRRIGHGSVIEK